MMRKSSALECCEVARPFPQKREAAAAEEQDSHRKSFVVPPKAPPVGEITNHQADLKSSEEYSFPTEIKNALAV